MLLALSQAKRDAIHKTMKVPIVPAIKYRSIHAATVVMCDLTSAISGGARSARRLQGKALARTACNQQAARRLCAAADRGR